MLQVLGVLMQCPRIPAWIAEHHRHTTAGVKAAVGKKAHKMLLPPLAPPPYKWGLLAPPPLLRFMEAQTSQDAVSCAQQKRKAERQGGRGVGAMQGAQPRFAMVHAGPVLPAPAAIAAASDKSPADSMQHDLNLSMDSWDLTDFRLSDSDLSFFG